MLLTIKKKIYPILLTVFITMLILMMYKADRMSPILVKDANNYVGLNYSAENNLHGKWRALSDNQVHSKNHRKYYHPKLTASRLRQKISQN